MKYYTLCLFTLLILTSCVPTKDLTYLKGEPLQPKEIKRLNDRPYRLQVGDVLNIDLKSTNEDLVTMFNKSNFRNSGINTNGNNTFNGGGGFQFGYNIDRHGNIRIPYIGEINVLGYTTVEVRKKLEKEFDKLFQNSDDIFIEVKLTGIKYTIMGEVGSPGTKIIPQSRVNIFEAITNSGDITRVGNRKKVEIIRFNSGEIKKFYIDLTRIDALDSEIFYIEPNDFINVLPLKQKGWGTDTTALGVLTTVVSVLSLVASSVVLARSL